MKTVKTALMLATAAALVSSGFGVAAQAETVVRVPLEAQILQDRPYYDSWIYWQPAVSDIDKQLVVTSQRLTDAYFRGFIGPMEYAELKRDFQAIREKEQWEARDRGLSEKDQKKLISMIEDFNERFDKHVSDELAALEAHGKTTR